MNHLDRFVDYVLAHPRRYWVSAVFLALFASLIVLVEADRFAESGRIDALQNEASRRAVEIMARTLGGKFMGSLGFLGLTYDLAKDVALNRLGPGNLQVIAVLELLGRDSGAEGCFIVDQKGVVQSSWDKGGKPSTGLDVRFRPYFQMAMEGKESIYAAVSLNTDRRALYYAAPVYGMSNKSSPVIGAACIRVGLEQIDAMLSQVGLPALLLTPNGVVFASTDPGWSYRLGWEATDKRIEAIRASKQFGRRFDKEDPKPLQFPLFKDVVEIKGRRFAQATAPVVWNDPQGDWTLVLLDDITEAISPAKAIFTILAVTAVMLLISFLALLLMRNRQIKVAARAAEELAARKLRESEANLRRILEASPIPILISRLADEEIILANERAGQYFGQTPAQLTGRAASSLYADPGDRQNILAGLDDCGRVKDAEVVFARADGSTFVALLSIELIVLGEEEVVLGGLLDITDRKRAEEEIKKANAELSEAMEVISSSIRYASRIQRSVLPDEELMARYAAGHFVLWKPRDVVGGDIYWYREWGQGLVVAMADCTGHGVPGAFMTLIAGGALDMALRHVPPGDPGALIASMHRSVQRVLSQNIEGGHSDDGLEIGVCYLTPGADSFLYAGAHFPLFIATGTEVEVVKGAKTGIGYRGVAKDARFENQVIPVAPGSRYYMATDGLFDQIGGERGRPYSKKRFVELLGELDARPLIQHGEAIYLSLLAYQGEQSRRDDVAVIGFCLGGNDALR